MNARTEGNTVKVTLSRRNLRALLSKLDWEGSARTIYRHCESGIMVEVTAEDDAAHYQDRAPGRMHPKTEAELATEG